MYNSIEEAVGEWRFEARLTQMVMDALTDQSLQVQVPMEGRTLGRLAWHLVQSAPSFMAELGLPVAQVEGPAPAAAKEIAQRWQQVSDEVAQAIESGLTAESLRQVQSLFGREMEKGTILALLLKHHAHHRGQMTVLMRMAGLVPPGIYGPTREAWQQMGQEPML